MKRLLRLQSFFSALLTLLVGSLATGYLTYNAKINAEFRAEYAFAQVSDEFQMRLLATLEAHKQVLLGGTGLFHASHQVDRDEWRAYTDHLRLDQHFNGVQGLGYAEWIPANRLAQHIAAIHNEGHPKYTVFPAGKRDGYSAVVFLEPFDWRNQRAFGFDMYSEPTRREAMERARDQNTITLSGKVLLKQETEQDVQAGFLMYAPVYRNKHPVDTVAQRRAALIGWVYSPFRMDDFITSILDGNRHHHETAISRILIFDGEQAIPDMLLYSNLPDTKSNGAEKQQIRHLNFGEHEWTLVMYQDDSVTDYSAAKWTLLAGSVVSMLLALFVSAFIELRKSFKINELTTKRLRRSEENLRLLAKNESVMVWMAGPDKKCTEFNSVWLDFTGRSLAQELGDGWSEGVHPEDLPHCLEAYALAFDARHPFTLEYRLRHHSGDYRWIIDHGVPRFDTDGTFTGYIGSCIDITERKKQELQLQLTQFATDHALIEIYWLNKDGRICNINAHACRSLGYSREELLQMSIPDLDPFYPIAQWRVHWDELKHDKSQLFETQHRRKDGTLIPVEVSANYVNYNGQEFNVAFCHDISERKKNEELIHSLAFFDPLTNLPNRRMLHDRLEKAIAASKRHQQFGVLLFLDLDNFKPLNDTYGHAVGDMLLARVADRIVDCVREIDTVARFGGDEFVILLSELSADKTKLRIQAGVVAEKIRSALSESYSLQYHPSDSAVTIDIEHRCSCSIGITLFDGRKDLADDIIKRADSAMYNAKTAGRNLVRFY